MDGRVYGLLAEFETPDSLLAAARRVREAGYTRWDAYSPYPVHGLDRAMGLRDTRLPWIVLAAGIAGTASGILMQWWMNAIDYAFVVGGKPLFSLPAQIPIAFEVTILFSAIACVVAMFAFNGLPRFTHPAFGSARFRRVTTDRFFIAIEAADPRFDIEHTEAFLRDAGSAQVEWLEE